MEIYEGGKMLNDLFGTGEFKLNVRKIQEQLVREALRIHIASINGRIEACMRCPIECTNPPGFKPAPTYRETDDDSPERLAQIPQLAPFAKIPFYPSVSERFGFGGTTRAKDLVEIAKKELQEIEDRIQDKERELNAVHKSNVHQINEGRKELGRLRDDFQRKKRAADARLEGMGGAYAQMEDTARQLADTEESLRRVTGEYGAAVHERDEARAARGDMAFQLDQQEEIIGGAETERDTAVADLAAEKTRHDEVLQKFKTTRTTIEAELATAKEKGENVEELERELDELKTKIENSETKQRDLQTALAAKTRDVARVEQERDALRAPVLTLGQTQPQHIAIAPQPAVLGQTQPQHIAIAPQPTVPAPVPVPQVVTGPTVQPSEAEVQSGTAEAGPQGRFEETSASVPEGVTKDPVPKPTEPEATEPDAEAEAPQATEAEAPQAPEEEQLDEKEETVDMKDETPGEEDEEAGPSVPAGPEEAERDAPWDLAKMSVVQLVARFDLPKISNKMSTAKSTRVGGVRKGRKVVDPKNRVVNANMPSNMVSKYWLKADDEAEEAQNRKDASEEMQGMIDPIQNKEYVMDLVSCLVYLGRGQVLIDHRGDKIYHPTFNSNATSRRTLTRMVTDYMAHYYEHEKMWEVTPLVVQAVLEIWWNTIMDAADDDELGFATDYWKWGVAEASSVMGQLEEQQFVVMPSQRPKLTEPYDLEKRGDELFRDLDSIQKVRNRQIGPQPSRHVQGMRGPGAVPVAARMRQSRSRS